MITSAQQQVIHIQKPSGSRRRVLKYHPYLSFRFQLRSSSSRSLVHVEEGATISFHGVQNVTQLLQQILCDLIFLRLPVISRYHRENYGQFHFSHAQYFTHRLINPLNPSCWLCMNHPVLIPLTATPTKGRFAQWQQRQYLSHLCHNNQPEHVDWSNTGPEHSRPPSCVPRAPGVISHPADLP